MWLHPHPETTLHNCQVLPLVSYAALMDIYVSSTAPGSSWPDATSPFKCWCAARFCLLWLQLLQGLQTCHTLLLIIEQLCLMLQHGLVLRSWTSLLSGERSMYRPTWILAITKHKYTNNCLEKMKERGYNWDPSQCFSKGKELQLGYKSVGDNNRALGELAESTSFVMSWTVYLWEIHCWTIVFGGHHWWHKRRGGEW